MGLIGLATLTLMVSRGAKYNRFRSLMQEVIWVGLHVGVEISVLVANDYVKLVFVALVLCRMWKKPQRILH